jgi:hypothetical protein
MLYKCSNCLKFFDQKSHYNYHINRKIPCKQKNIINQDITISPNKEVDISTLTNQNDIIDQDNKTTSNSQNNSPNKQKNIIDQDIKTTSSEDIVTNIPKSKILSFNEEINNIIIKYKLF